MKKNNYLIICMMLLVVSLVFGCGKDDTEIATTEATTTATTEASKEKDESKETFSGAYSFTLTVGNSWEQDGLIFAQYDGVIKNQTKENGTDWKVTLKVPSGAVCNDGWNGTYDISGDTLTISSVDYNKEVASGSEITFGFIMGTPAAYTPDGQLVISGNTVKVNDSSAAVTKDEKKDTESTTEDKKSDGTGEKKELPSKKNESGTPVTNHGKLSVKGVDIVDEQGNQFQLKGVSTHGIAWFPDYVNKDAFASLADRGANAIRIAMYSDENNGYCSGGDKAKLEGLVDTGVQACKDLGLYVIVDWHVLGEGNPNVHIEEAKTFFDMVSKKYASDNNVIYEICNEPNGSVTWSEVKTYAETIIPIIRANDKDAIIIVGTPTWSQDADIASKDPIQGYDNIMYAVHFYATTHTDNIRNKVETARSNGAPVIISECSICDASGNGAIDYNQADLWMDLIEKDNLSYFIWNLSNKDETSSILKPSCTSKTSFTDDDFSETGKYFMEQFAK